MFNKVAFCRLVYKFIDNQIENCCALSLLIITETKINIFECLYHDDKAISRSQVILIVGAFVAHISISKVIALILILVTILLTIEKKKKTTLQ